MVGARLAVVFTAGNYGDYRVWRLFRDEMVANVIIPAIAQSAQR